MIGDAVDSFSNGCSDSELALFSTFSLGVSCIKLFKCPQQWARVWIDSRCHQLSVTLVCIWDCLHPKRKLSHGIGNPTLLLLLLSLPASFTEGSWAHRDALPYLLLTPCQKCELCPGWVHGPNSVCGINLENLDLWVLGIHCKISTSAHHQHFWERFFLLLS